MVQMSTHGDELRNKRAIDNRRGGKEYRRISEIGEPMECSEHLTHRVFESVKFFFGGLD